MSLLMLYVVAAFAQAPTQHAAPAAQPRCDTIYVAVPSSVTVQAPPAAVTVEAQSQWPAIFLGLVGLLLLALQLRIMGRQTDVMRRQTTLLDKQTEIQEQQDVSQRTEAIGTFYRIAFDLVDEFRRANLMTGTPIPANFDTHLRQMLREAARHCAASDAEPESKASAATPVGLVRP